MTKAADSIYQKKKRRIFGELIEPVETKTKQSWISIHRSSKDLLITYESQGLIMAVMGGSVHASHPDVALVSSIMSHVIGAGGIIFHGGRSGGIISPIANVGTTQGAGVIFPEQKTEAWKGPTAVVNAPTPRIELLATCAPVIVIFRGGLGTFQVLMRSIVHIKNRSYHPEQLPQLLFISDYWIGLLTTMVSLGILHQDFLSAITFFHTPEQVISKIPSLSSAK